MFAGVGPFSIQIAKRAPQSHVTAIDVNPDAICYLRENIKLNGLGNVEAIEGDVKEILREVQKQGGQDNHEPTEKRLFVPSRSSVYA